ncbi:S8/S53 family peptidase [Actinoplanes sp. TRM 88003]|uniref:S8/S53 family peptidase n=1 Tax=Paractinoplanes aksuensis TaxID=2939490 RepID=A0ABT1DFB7_9ACTN|nr:S8/S53 family peptidase [Actinoplanes aksuensis]MCO8269521.1 S8/S53 family peptidase [Actinoplanes aksuensis]
MVATKLDPDHLSADTLTAGPGVTAEDLNSAGLSLAAHDRSTGTRQIVTVDKGQALEACDLLTASGIDVRIDHDYVGGTGFMGKHWGHGFTWSEVTMLEKDKPVQPPWEKLPDGLRRPVIALLDTGVEHHPWIRVGNDDDPFVLPAEELDWPRPFPPIFTPFAPGQGPGRDAGHATFIAGLIRGAAPSARILSLRVMNDQGKVQESRVLEALTWLSDYAGLTGPYAGAGRPVDVVCMAFGREPDDPDPFDEVEAAMKPFVAAGIPLVASAGNDHQADEVRPASSRSVIAVGAGFGRYHADFSNFGPWVNRYRDGVDILGILPGTAADGSDGRWVKWSGTSFAAANFAADLARPQVDHGHV